MAKRNVLIDKTEIVVNVEDKKGILTPVNLMYSDISRIQFDTHIETQMFFKKIPSEKIMIISRKLGKPAIFTKMKEKLYWDEYKTGLKKFAADNYITFENNLD